MKKKLVTTLLAGVMAASMVMPALASGNGVGAVPSGDGTQVWAGIIIEDVEAKIKVEVPTLFAFVVKGTTTTAAGVGVTDDDLYLPNFKVDVTTPSTSGTGAVFNLEQVGTLTEAGKLPFTNYSTQKGATGRVGLPVMINGNITNEGEAISRNYWTHTASTGTTVATTDFKHYNVSIDGNEFDTAAIGGGLQMAGKGIALTAPDETLNGDNIDPVTGYAKIGETYQAEFGVTVGGERGQYRQVEQSAKIGKIVWTISAEIEGDVDTAPNEDYLQN